MKITSNQTASGLSWQPRASDDRLALAMAQQHGISELLASILAGRNVTLDDVPRFLNPTLRDDLPDPFHLRDMDKAVARIAKALAEKQPIAVFGDYDVDGATSTALLHHYFAALGVAINPYIPDRMKEGYGPTVEGFCTLIDGGAKLIITVDCGTLAHAPIAYVHARGVDVIVLDHHLSSGALPMAHAVVNPNRVDETSAHTNLAAVGVTFLLLVALNKYLRAIGYFESLTREPNLLPLLDMVALGTVCDVMPLTGLNRALVAQGLKVMAGRRNLGLAVLGDVARLEEAPNVYHLGFLLGPRINAGGRVGAAGLGVALLSSTDEFAARAMAETLDKHNAERQAIEAMVSEQAFAAAAAQANLPVIMVAGKGWHQGVIGIVAGRLKEKFQRPAVVIALEEGMGKASARSVPGADFGAAVHAALAEELLTAGGGHAMAAGFSVKEELLEKLHRFLIARLEAPVNRYNESRVKKFDGFLSVSGANLDTLDEIGRAEPYGLGNPSPRFIINDAQILNYSIMKEKHLRLVLGDASGAVRLNAVAFNAVGTPLGNMLMSHRSLHLLGELKRNRWQGREAPQWLIDDAAKTA